MHNLRWIQTEKDNALTKCSINLRAWVSQKPMLCFHAVTDEEGRPLDDEDAENKSHHAYETIPGFVQKAPEDIQWTIDKQEFNEIIATKKESPPGPDGFPYGIHICAGGFGFRFLFNACKSVVLSPHILLRADPFSFPNVQLSMTLGLIVRSPDALRSLTLCNCDCKIITTAICCGLHKFSMRCIHRLSDLSTRQMTNNIFEVETTALAQFFACVTRGSGMLLTDFACACPCVSHSWIFHVLEKAELPRFIRQFLRMIYNNIVADVEFAGKTRGLFLKARGVRQGRLASGFLFAMALDPIFRWLHGSVIPRNLHL